MQVNSLYDNDLLSDWRVDRGWLLFDEAGLLLRCNRHLCLHRHSLPSLADFVSGDGDEKHNDICHFVYTIAIGGQEILHLKVCKFATKVVLQQNCV